MKEELLRDILTELRAARAFREAPTREEGVKAGRRVIDREANTVRFENGLAYVQHPDGSLHIDEEAS